MSKPPNQLGPAAHAQRAAAALATHKRNSDLLLKAFQTGVSYAECTCARGRLAVSAERHRQQPARSKVVSKPSPIGGKVKATLAALLLLLCADFAGGTALAQEKLPDAPSVAHTRFFDTHNKLLMVHTASLFAADAITTNRMLSQPNGRETNPIARPFVTKGAGMQALYWSASYGTVIGTS